MNGVEFLTSRQFEGLTIFFLPNSNIRVQQKTTWEVSKGDFYKRPSAPSLRLREWLAIFRWRHPTFGRIQSTSCNYFLLRHRPSRFLWRKVFLGKWGARRLDRESKGRSRLESRFWREPREIFRWWNWKLMTLLTSCRKDNLVYIDEHKLSQVFF